MNINQTSPQMANSHLMRQQAMTVIELRRFWLGVDGTTLTTRMTHLHVDAITDVIMAGRHVHYRDWTIQPTPPRSIPGANGQREWTPGLIASSVHGFTTALRIDQRNVAFICHYIQQRDRTISLISNMPAPYDSDMEEAEETEAAVHA